MAINRSVRFEQIRDETFDQYVSPPKDERNRYWFTHYAPMWRNRVGIARLTADAASLEAVSLLRSINPGLFRNDPETLALLHTAQEAAAELATAMARDSWRRFQAGDPKKRNREDADR